MSKLNDLIAQLCPDGIPYKKLEEVAEVKRGRRVVKKELSQDSNSGHPVYQNSLKPLGYHTCSNEKAGTPFVIAAGSAGEIGYSDVDYWGADDCYSIECDDNTVNGRYIYHVLLLKQGRIKSQVRRASIPRLSSTAIRHLTIPLPPLPVQSEVVRILDAFTELEAELEAELADRIEQYEYFRARLFDDKNLERMDGGKIEHDTVNSLVDVITPTAKIKKNEYKEVGLFPVIDQGMNTVIAGYTDNANALPDNEWILFGDHTCSLKYFDGRFVQGADGLKILKAHDNVLPKFVFYALKNLNVSSNEYARHWTSFKKNELPVPSLATQERIVDILDRFDTLTTSLTKGIPAEIAMRREQYEYYRARLLDFPRLPEDSDSNSDVE